jgi:hypothetical protein
MYWNKVDESLFIVSESEGRYFTDACGNPYSVYVHRNGKCQLHYIESGEFFEVTGLAMLSEARARWAQ